MTKRLPILALAAATILAGCSSSSKGDKLLTDLANQDKDTIYQRAESLYSDGDYEEARKLYSFIYDTFPNDPLGHKAALRVADTYAQFKDSARLTESRLRYRDFASRYPNDPQRDYALLMLGVTYTAKKLHPDRDLGELHEAVKSFQQLINLYPDSQYVPQAREELATLKGVLAEHEVLVARYYLRNKDWQGAIQRIEFLQENYPEYQGMERADKMLADAKKGLEEAKARFAARVKPSEDSLDVKPEDSPDSKTKDSQEPSGH